MMVEPEDAAGYLLRRSFSVTMPGREWPQLLSRGLLLSS